jgi:hypothetical protein
MHHDPAAADDGSTAVSTGQSQTGTCGLGVKIRVRLFGHQK